MQKERCRAHLSGLTGIASPAGGKHGRRGGVVDELYGLTEEEIAIVEAQT